MNSEESKNIKKEGLQAVNPEAVLASPDAHKSLEASKIARTLSAEQLKGILNEKEQSAGGELNVGAEGKKSELTHEQIESAMNEQVVPKQALETKTQQTDAILKKRLESFLEDPYTAMEELKNLN